MKSTIFVLFSFLILSPSSFAVESKFPTRANEDNLTRTFAEFRKAQVKSVSYDLTFTLTKGSTSYEGRAVIKAKLSRVDAPLSLDFVAKKIQFVTVNGTRLNAFTVRTGSLDIPAKFLKKDTKITIEYTNDFNPSPAGFYRSVDPTDQREYLYTDFEPYQAHLLFPCFDQPDLKASFQMQVTAPKEWKVISNGLASKPTLMGEQAQTDFSFSKPISTYLFFLGAGDYQEWTDHYGTLPLYLYSRQSVAKYVDSKMMFDITKKGLAFYENYFGQKYPFPKYGQVFIPDFMFGGMENPGAITLNELYLARGQITSDQVRRRTNVVLHEMAHMWFGDLVTMKWWNDTWLNESFATYMSMLCQSEALKDLDTWNDFFAQKTWGYWQDDLVTTHPIEAPIIDTLNARDNFDGITYAKGASALQQLHYYVGPQSFKNGVQAYFKKYAGKNTERADFVGEIAKASGQDLDAWTHAWLQTAGPNRVSVDWSCKNNKILNFVVKQQPNTQNTLSPHRSRVALFHKNASGKLAATKTQIVSYQDAETPVNAFVGLSCPDFVYANDGDEDYALFSLDPVSLETAQKSLSELNDPLLRLMTWEALGQMLRDGRLSPSDYLKVAVEALKNEKSESVTSVLLGKKSSFRGNYFIYPTPEQREAIAPELEALVWKHAFEAPKGSGLQLVYLDFAISISRTADSMEILSAILDGTKKVDGVEIDQDRRWAILTALAASNAPGIEQKITVEAKKDSSSRGKASAYTAHIAVPRADVKAIAWNDLLNPSKLDESTFRSAKNWFQDANHPELSRAYVDRFFKTLATMNWSDQVHHDRVSGYFQGLFPNLCTQELLTRSQEELSHSKNLNDMVKRSWLETNDMLGRCVRARATNPVLSKSEE